MVQSEKLLIRREIKGTKQIAQGNCPPIKNGSERRSMGGSAAGVCGTTSSRRQGTTVAGCKRSAQRCALDSAHRSAMAGSPPPLSAVSDLPSSLSTVAAGRTLRSDSADAGARPGGTRRHRSERRLHRRLLQRGQKGGSGDGAPDRLPPERQAGAAQGDEDRALRPHRLLLHRAEADEGEAEEAEHRTRGAR